MGGSLSRHLPTANSTPIPPVASRSNYKTMAKADLRAIRAAAPASPGPPATVDGLPQPELIAAIPRLRRYARVLTGNPTRADDLVQDTLVRAWEKRRLWQSGSDLRAWLFTIMHNVHVNQLALARREAGTLSLDAEGTCATVEQLPIDGNQLDRIELLELVQRMSRLTAAHRELLLLAAVEELHYDEIAWVLAIPVGTVMSRLSRARAKLRRMAAEPPTPIQSTRNAPAAVARRDGKACDKRNIK
jgi:RNA polymerase sigma-70 factor, ECF subfamily